MKEEHLEKTPAAEPLANGQAPAQPPAKPAPALKPSSAAKPVAVPKSAAAAKPSAAPKPAPAKAAAPKPAAPPKQAAAPKPAVAAKQAAAPKPAAPAEPAAPKSIVTLAVDVGGTGIKSAALDEKGKMITERQKIKTPRNATPKKVIAIIAELAKLAGDFDRVSVGFPGVIKNGVVYTAPNLGKGWENYPLEAALKKKLERPVRIANDADVQGLSCVTGHGDELVITLGTGFGSVLFVDGHRMHLELAHHPFHNGKTYEDELGNEAFLKRGKKKWNKHLREAIDELAKTFNYDRLYIGGGNAAAINFELPPNVKAVSNTDGLLGGIKLWQDEAAAK
jgi:polyphosphate glucokinase